MWMLTRTLLANRSETGGHTTLWLGFSSRRTHLDEARAGDGEGTRKGMRDAGGGGDVGMHGNGDGNGGDNAYPARTENDGARA
jgi:hypothetical protein